MVDLLNMLAKLNNNVEYSDKQIEEMTLEQKSKLIQRDPVTSTRYFDHRVQEFIKIVLKSTHILLVLSQTTSTGQNFNKEVLLIFI